MTKSKPELPEIEIRIAQNEDFSFTVYAYDVMLDELGDEVSRARMDLTSVVLVSNVKDEAGKIAGVPSAALLFATPTVTMEDTGKTFDASFLGKRITIAGMTSPGNDGTFFITGFTDTTIDYTNAMGVAEAIPAGATYLISDIVIDKNSGDTAQIEIHANQSAGQPASTDTRGTAIIKYVGADTTLREVGARYWHDVWAYRASGKIRVITKSRFHVDDGVHEPATGVIPSPITPPTSGGGTSGGWIRITGITVPGGSTGNAVYQDPGGDTILQSIEVSDGAIDVAVEASYPLVTVGAISATLPLVGSIYSGTVSVVLAASSPVIATVIDPNGDLGPIDTVSVVIDVPPELLTFVFSGGYPGAQTELKAGDIYQISGTLDKSADAIEVQATGASDSVQLITFAAGLSFSVTMVVGDQGVVLQALPASARPRSSTNGAFGAVVATNQGGGSADGVDLVNMNNLLPGIVLGAIVYPVTQGALKGVETATVVNGLTDFDSVAYDSPNGDLTITLPAMSEDPKTVTRLAGTYNDSVNNFRVTANRAANDGTSVAQLVVVIANVAAQLTVAEPAARLRSGGANGTAPQDHQITITSDQSLPAAPTLAPDAGARGVFQGLFTGGPLAWVADLRVDDADDKGTFPWGAIAATNLAGIATAAITGDSDYVLGGFVSRDLTFAAFATTSQLDVEVVDFTKLTASIFTSTGQPALKQPISTPPSVTDGYTIDAIAISPAQLLWLDSPAASANSGGTAQITNVEESV